MRSAFSFGIFAFAVFLTSSAFAEDTVVASMKYMRVNGKASFGAKWFPNSQSGAINLGLLWRDYGPAVKNGFALPTASTKEFVSPALPAGCSLKELRGSLAWSAGQMSAIGIKLEGAACAPFFDELRKLPLRIRFGDVRHLTDDASTETLILDVGELP